MSVREIFARYGQEYLDAYGQKVPNRHRKVLHSIINCRTPALGAILCGCESCGTTYTIYRSCGDRHCPTCQGEKANAWLHKRLGELLPVAYFMITFTVPQAFRELFRSHQREMYRAFFQATSSVMMKLSSESTYFPGDMPGFFGVLHTWGRQLQYHPHIHYVVPGGAFCSDDHRWNPSHQAFYLPVRVLSRLVKKRMYSALNTAELLDAVPPEAWGTDWNVNSQATGTGERSIRYLAAYVFRTAISDTRILNTDNGKVLFRYTDRRTGKQKRTELSAHEFIRRFLQHVLPRGFMKIRYYGFLHPSSHIPLKVAVAILEAAFCIPAPVHAECGGSPFIPRCPTCQTPVKFLCFIPPEQLVHSGFG